MSIRLDFANLMNEMRQRQRYKKVLFLTDTCQAFTLADKVTSPNVYTVASSLRDESAYAHHTDADLGLAVIERYTHSMVEYYYNRTSSASSVHDVLVQPFLSGSAPRLTNKGLGANIGVKEDLSDTKLSAIPMSDFFGPRRGGSPIGMAVVDKDAGPEIDRKNWIERRGVVPTTYTDFRNRVPSSTAPKVESCEEDIILATNGPDQDGFEPWEPSSRKFLSLVASLGILFVILTVWDQQSSENEDNLR